ncbi:MAG: DUF2586 family protein [Thermoplasmataceae archaeon]
MPSPSIGFGINSNGLGQFTPTGSQTPLLIGWANGGPAAGDQNPIQLIGSESVAQSIYNSGPLYEEILAHLAQGITPLALRIFSGTIAAGTHTGTGTGTITPSGAPMAPYDLIVKISTASGAASAGYFTYSLDGGNTYSAPIEIPASPFAYVLPNTGITLTFSAQVGAGVWVLNDTYAQTITAATGAIGGISQVNPTKGSPQGAGGLTISGAPIDEYHVVIAIVTSGSIYGTAGKPVAQFQVSLDGGNTFGPVTTLQAGNDPTIGEDNDVTVTFANTGGAGAGTAFIAGDQYLFSTTPPAYTNTDLTNALAVVQGYTANPCDFIHVLGRSATAELAYGEAGTLDTAMASFKAANVFTFAIMDMPIDTAQANADSAFQAAFAAPNLPSLRVVVGAGDLNLKSLDGTQLQRCCSSALSIDLALIPPGQDAAWVGAGGVPGVADILRDESLLLSLDSYGFTTMRRWLGRNGFYFVDALVMGAAGTDFNYLVMRRVMDLACKVAYNLLLPYVNGSLLANVSTGTIDEKQARTIERAVNKALFNQVVQPPGQNGPNCTAATITLDRSADIAQTATLPVNLTVEALLYGRTVSVTAGFVLSLATQAGG